jgi:AcrB/AcrD/AcrF family protein
MVPLLVAKGAGAASRFDIGVVIAAGMTIGTLFTLFVTPAVYTYLARDHQKAKAEAEAALAHATAATHGDAVPETVVEADTAAEAGMLFPAPEEPVPAEDQLSPEATAFSSAASAVSSQGHEQQTGPRRGRGPKLPTAAE